MKVRDLLCKKCGGEKRISKVNAKAAEGYTFPPCDACLLELPDGMKVATGKQFPSLWRVCPRCKGRTYVYPGGAPCERCQDADRLGVHPTGLVPLTENVTDAYLGIAKSLGVYFTLEWAEERGDWEVEIAKMPHAIDRTGDTYQEALENAIMEAVT